MTELTLEQLIEARGKTFQNASDLILDAENLYEHERWARCVFLSSIAIEEIGKYLMIIGAIGRVLIDQMAWKRFWKRFRSHTKKSRNILVFDVFLGSFISSDDTLNELQKTLQDAREIENEKLSSLYLDFESNKFNLPMDLFDEAAARKALDSAKAVLKFFEYGESLAFRKMTVSSISREKFIEAVSLLKDKAKNSDKTTS